MTVEQKIVFGLEEITAVIFECNECKSRASINTEHLSFPPQRCPSGHSWDWNLASPFGATDSPFRMFISSLGRLRDPLSEKVGFKILLEINKPKD